MAIAELGGTHSHEVLMPAKPAYVALSFFVAFMLNMLPLTGWVLMIRPDFVAAVLLYWAIQHPRKVGFTPVFLLGLAMDVADGSLFGQHALAYCVLTAAGITLHRRISLFGLRGQMLHILGILLVAQLIVLMVRIAADNAFPGWWYFLPSVSGSLLWPLVCHFVALPLRSRAKTD
ncbi:MAG: rod shape-determining protein MreD [Betaproteobacteria bacterium]|jgi:rod shape-determining protein MreD|nr:MAG: rod shape-determining protein MreD [Betaproteobacteria bacterium]